MAVIRLILGASLLVLVLYRARFGDDGWRALLATVGVMGGALAAIVSWPLVSEAWLLRHGVRTTGIIVEKTSSSIVFEYRECYEPATERLHRQHVALPKALTDAARVGEEVVVYHSLWRPARSLAVPFCQYEIEALPPAR
jgi:hypothetical protein